MSKQATDTYRIVPGDTVQDKQTRDTGVVTSLRKIGYAAGIVGVVVYYASKKISKTYFMKWGEDGDIKKVASSLLSSLKKQKVDTVKKSNDFDPTDTSPSTKAPLSVNEATHYSSTVDKTVERIVTSPSNGITNPKDTRLSTYFGDNLGGYSVTSSNRFYRPNILSQNTLLTDEAKSAAARDIDTIYRALYGSVGVNYDPSTYSHTNAVLDAVQKRKTISDLRRGLEDRKTRKAQLQAEIKNWGNPQSPVSNLRPLEKSIPRDPSITLAHVRKDYHAVLKEVYDFSDRLKQESTGFNDFLYERTRPIVQGINESYLNKERARLIQGLGLTNKLRSNFIDKGITRGKEKHYQETLSYFDRRIERYKPQIQSIETILASNRSGGIEEFLIPQNQIEQHINLFISDRYKKLNQAMTAFNTSLFEYQDPAAIVIPFAPDRLSSNTDTVRKSASDMFRYAEELRDLEQLRVYGLHFNFNQLDPGDNLLLKAQLQRRDLIRSYLDDAKNVASSIPTSILEELKSFQTPGSIGDNFTTRGLASQQGKGSTGSLFYLLGFVDREQGSLSGSDITEQNLERLARQRAYQSVPESVTDKDAWVNANINGFIDSMDYFGAEAVEANYALSKQILQDTQNLRHFSAAELANLEANGIPLAGNLSSIPNTPLQALLDSKSLRPRVENLREINNVLDNQNLRLLFSPTELANLEAKRIALVGNLSSGTSLSTFYQNPLRTINQSIVYVDGKGLLVENVRHSQPLDKDLNETALEYASRLANPDLVTIDARPLNLTEGVISIPLIGNMETPVPQTTKSNILLDFGYIGERPIINHPRKLTDTQIVKMPWESSTSISSRREIKGFKQLIQESFNLDDELLKLPVKTLLEGFTRSEKKGFTEFEMEDLTQSIKVNFYKGLEAFTPASGPIDYVKTTNQLLHQSIIQTALEASSERSGASSDYIAHVVSKAMEAEGVGPSKVLLQQMRDNIATSMASFQPIDVAGKSKATGVPEADLLDTVMAKVAKPIDPDIQLTASILKQIENRSGVSRTFLPEVTEDYLFWKRSNLGIKDALFEKALRRTPRVPAKDYALIPIPSTQEDIQIYQAELSKINSKYESRLASLETKLSKSFPAWETVHDPFVDEAELELFVRGKAVNNSKYREALAKYDRRKAVLSYQRDRAIKHLDGLYNFNQRAIDRDRQFNEDILQASLQASKDLQKETARKEALKAESKIKSIEARVRAEVEKHFPMTEGFTIEAQQEATEKIIQLNILKNKVPKVYTSSTKVSASGVHSSVKVTQDLNELEMLTVDLLHPQLRKQMGESFSEKSKRDAALRILSGVSSQTIDYPLASSNIEGMLFDLANKAQSLSVEDRKRYGIIAENNTYTIPLQMKGEKASLPNSVDLSTTYNMKVKVAPKGHLDISITGPGNVSYRIGQVGDFATSVKPDQIDGVKSLYASTLGHLAETIDSPVYKIPMVDGSSKYGVAFAAKASDIPEQVQHLKDIFSGDTKKARQTYGIDIETFERSVLDPITKRTVNEEVIGNLTLQSFDRSQNGLNLVTPEYLDYLNNPKPAALIREDDFYRVEALFQHQKEVKEIVRRKMRAETIDVASGRGVQEVISNINTDVDKYIKSTFYTGIKQDIASRLGMSYSDIKDEDVVSLMTSSQKAFIDEVENSKVLATRHALLQKSIKEGKTKVVENISSEMSDRFVIASKMNPDLRFVGHNIINFDLPQLSKTLTPEAQAILADIKSRSIDTQDIAPILRDFGTHESSGFSLSINQLGKQILRPDYSEVHIAITDEHDLFQMLQKQFGSRSDLPSSYQIDWSKPLEAVDNLPGNFIFDPMRKRSFKLISPVKIDKDAIKAHNGYETSTSIGFLVEEFDYGTGSSMGRRVLAGADKRGMGIWSHYAQMAFETDPNLVNQVQSASITQLAIDKALGIIRGKETNIRSSIENLDPIIQSLAQQHLDKLESIKDFPKKELRKEVATLIRDAHKVKIPINAPEPEALLESYVDFVKQNSIKYFNEPKDLVERLTKQSQIHSVLMDAQSTSKALNTSITEVLRDRAKNLVQSSDQLEKSVGSYIHNYMLNDDSVAGTRQIAQYMQLTPFFNDMKNIHTPVINSIAGELSQPLYRDRAILKYFAEYYNPENTSNLSKEHFEMLGLKEYPVTNFTQAQPHVVPDISSIVAEEKRHIVYPLSQTPYTRHGSYGENIDSFLEANLEDITQIHKLPKVHLDTKYERAAHMVEKMGEFFSSNLGKAVLGVGAIVLAGEVINKAFTKPIQDEETPSYQSLDTPVQESKFTEEELIEKRRSYYTKSAQLNSPSLDANKRVKELLKVGSTSSLSDHRDDINDRRVNTPRNFKRT